MDGFEVCNSIQGHPEHILIVLCGFFYTAFDYMNVDTVLKYLIEVWQLKGLPNHISIYTRAFVNRVHYKLRSYP
jgi:hypothetical protein